MDMDLQAAINSSEISFYQNSTFELVSSVAYLIGVPERIFDNKFEPPKKTVFQHLEREKSARIIRNLCVLRTAIVRNFKHINDKMRMEYRTPLSMHEYIPAESINQLFADGIFIFRKPNVSLNQYIIKINLLISDRINNCKNLFPLWLNWQYIRALFLMPDGLNESGTKAASDLYHTHIHEYPYQMYINWEPRDEGNILYNDKKFVALLYQHNSDRFSEFSKVTDASSYVKGSIYDFIENSEQTVMVVDCENSDPYKLCATLKNIDYEYTSKISRIILFDDVHTVSAWSILVNFTKIPIDHILIERVKQNKSLVDIKLTARACQEHYQNHVDSFIIVSSDSDYWGLISSLPDARFLVMLERENCGPDLKRELINAGIFFCYIDDFYSGNTEDIRHVALFKEMYRYIDNAVSLNVNEMFEAALKATRVEMTNLEKQQFFSKYVKTLQMSISPSGDIMIEFKIK